MAADGADGMAAGEAALARAEWRTAREAFRQALDRDVTPEALEGLAWAAYWLDEGSDVFSY